MEDPTVPSTIALRPDFAAIAEWIKPSAKVLDLKTFMSEYLNAGQITFWPPYERIHENNVQKMRHALIIAKF